MQNESKGVRLDLTINLGQLITLMGVVFALVIGFTKAAEETKVLRRDADYQMRLIERVTESDLKQNEILTRLTTIVERLEGR